MNIKEAVISIGEEVFQGDMLDIASGDNGIIYNFYKEYNNEIAVDYVNSKNKVTCNIDHLYDTCVLLFTLGSITYNIQKSSLLRDINKYLKEGGRIYIWDMDKGCGKVFSRKIRILSPSHKGSNICVKDYNLIKDNSMKTMLKLIRKYFCICDLKTYDGIFYIKAIKRDENDKLDIDLNIGKKL